MFSLEITEDGKYICFYVMKDSSRVKFPSHPSLPFNLCLFIVSQQNLLWIADLEPEKLGVNIQWKKVLNDWGAEFDV